MVIICFRTIDNQHSQHNSFYERSSKRSINIPIEIRRKQSGNNEVGISKFRVKTTFMLFFLLS